MSRMQGSLGIRLVHILFSLAFLGTSSAMALEPAKGQVVLTVSGEISAANSRDVAELDLDLLQSIGTVTFQTTTIWTEGVQTFTGVELVDLLKAVGANGRVLRASAINDYSMEIPMSDAVEGGPIVAFLRNGATMSLRNKGPLWIVYPYDEDSDYRSELIYSRSVWQLDRIEVLR
ncbi:molybdopterin-dependent oxidoreductase [Silicimonas sp. MF1-12-2]|uniref:molybdopterin-dependent oxidoreductase n=1 Tax=Silicimonas sp. MF1-12-2 TaxID=3384793 RepID=UPI0039B5AFBF